VALGENERDLSPTCHFIPFPPNFLFPISVAD
jgi:hypothetical protein